MVVVNHEEINHDSQNKQCLREHCQKGHTISLDTDGRVGEVTTLM